MEELKKNLLQAARAAFTEKDALRIEDALAWNQARLAGKTRASGEPAALHGLRIARDLLDMGLDADSVAAGLLHDALEAKAEEKSENSEIKVEDRKAALAREHARQGEEAARLAALRGELVERFGEATALLVEDVSRLASLKARNKTQQAALTIRKMLFAMARDIRVIIIKLADKLDSMRTLKWLPEARQKEIAAECVDVYAPLADRLGISWLKDELEDLSLKAVNREAFDQIKDLVAAKKGERGSYLAAVESDIKKAAAAEGLEVEVFARAKHFYSIYLKMRKRAKAAEDIFDLLGLRLICAGEGECYALLGLVHRLWKPIEGRFKDYIAMPKANGYRSLHTTVMCREGRLLEVQIRTSEMHRVAEHGVASHWLYKRGDASETPRSDELSMSERFRQWGEFLVQGAEYLDAIKRELLGDSIFVFTPRGDAIRLPAGATPLDFAYEIHSGVGERCIGAKVNGHIVSLDRELGNTEVVEILTSPNAKPNMDWLALVKTSKARAGIRAALVRSGQVLAIERNIVAGRKTAQGDDSSSHAAPSSYATSPRTMTPNAPRGSARYGVGRDSLEHETKAELAHAAAGALEAPVLDYRSFEPGRELRSENAGLSIGGAKNFMIRIAGCCRPMTGDPIVGYVSRGRGIIVHRADCRTVKAIADFAERRIDVRWENFGGLVNARFRITAARSANLFSEIEGAVKKVGGRLREGHVGERGDGTMTGFFTMEADSRESLKKIARAVRGIPSVRSIEEEEGF